MAKKAGLRARAKSVQAAMTVAKEDVADSGNRRSSGKCRLTDTHQFGVICATIPMSVRDDLDINCAATNYHRCKEDRPSSRSNIEMRFYSRTNNSHRECNLEYDSGNVKIVE